jgi:hypothetical protein
LYLITGVANGERMLEWGMKIIAGGCVYLVGGGCLR